MYLILGIDIGRVRRARRIGNRSRMPAQRPAPAPGRARPGACRKIEIAASSPVRGAPRTLENRGLESAQHTKEARMTTASSVSIEPIFETAVGSVAELDRLGDEIAELSAHLDAATARLLDLIREFDARGGWNNGFHSCAAWLSWRVGLDPGAARERVRVARALGTLPRLAQALARGELHARTATPGWLGERLDVGWAIDVLHPLSLRPSLA